MTTIPQFIAAYDAWVATMQDEDGDIPERNFQRYDEGRSDWGEDALDLLSQLDGAVVVSVENREGTQEVVGPFADPMKAEEYAATRRSESDDDPWFAWVVPLNAPEEEPKQA